MADRTNDTVVHESMEIAAPAPEIWAALITHEVRTRWWGYLELEPTVGGRVAETWSGPDGTTTRTHGEVIALVHTETLRLRWADEAWDDSTEVEFQLRPGDHGTVVHIQEHGLDRFPDGDRIADEHRAGWRTHLSNLRRCVEARPAPATANRASSPGHARRP